VFPGSASRTENAAGNPGEASVRAEIDRVSFRNAENGWTVLRIRNCDDNSTVTATGHFAEIRPGELFQMFGAWANHPTYGRQLKVERSVPLRPSSRAAMERYLGSGLIHGIGPKTAARIVAHFGEDTFKILDDNPGCLMQVKSINKKKAKAIIEAWSAQKAVSDVMMFLSNHGISPTFATRIFKAYGPDAINIVSGNPWKLAEDIDGIGFLNADKIAQRVGIAPNSPHRVRAGILYALGQSEERGHCYATDPQLADILLALLQIDADDIAPLMPEALTDLNKSGHVVTEKNVLIVAPVARNAAGQGGDVGMGDGVESTRETVHYSMDILVAESNVALLVGRMLQRPVTSDGPRIEHWLNRYTEASGTQFSTAQLAAVRAAAASRMFILTGGPGVGKTTTANAIIRLLKAMGKTVALAAPTGRAAQRLSEVAAEKARTIHRLLEWQPGAAGFTRDETNPLACDVVIVDEASMLDIRLADALIRAVPERAQLILIGDVDQLPSVGPGNVLRDLIDSTKVPCARLTEIFRQAATSGIVRSAHAINNGEAPSFTRGGDCEFEEVENGEDLRQRVRDLVSREIPHRMGLDPITDVQVLTPMNRGELGTQQLNLELQELLNPRRNGEPTLTRGGIEFRRRDKVIQNSNNYDLGVFNGDIGTVMQAGVEGGKMIVAYPDGRVVRYEGEHISELRLAYAITVHKSQGSEFPAVVMPVSTQHWIMLQRNLVYTGLTRARRQAVLVGSMKALGHAVRNQSSLKRQTLLIGRLEQALSR